MEYEITKEIIQRMPIEKIIGKYMVLKAHGSNWIGICPFHPETKPTLKISHEKNIYKCFVCGAGGDGIHFVKEYLQISFVEAMNKIIQES